MKKLSIILIALLVLFSSSCSSVKLEIADSTMVESNSDSSFTQTSEPVSESFDDSETVDNSTEQSNDKSECSEFEEESIESNSDYEESSVNSETETDSGINIEDDSPSNSESKTETVSSVVESETENVSSVIESELPDESTDSEIEDETSESVSVIEPNGAVFVSNGILIAGTRGMEQYYGSEASGKQYCSYVSAFKNDLGNDVNVYSIVVPHASCYYAPPAYSNLLTRGQVNFNNLKTNAGENVKYVDVYEALSKHTDEDIYPRTEHHWNALGAYYAAEEFTKIAGVPFASLNEYEKITKEGFVGTLYAFSKSSVLLNNPEDFVIYKPTQEYTAYFCNEGNYNFDNYNYSRDSVVFDVKSYAGAFLGGDSVWVKIVTGNTNGRKLVIFKDSYGNAFVPFTIGSFEEIYVLDLRNYNRNGVEFCNSVGATDVAFVVSGFTATGSVYKNIEKIRTAP